MLSQEDVEILVETLEEGCAALVEDQPPFRKIHIDWRAGKVVVDGKKMSMGEAKRRGYVRTDGIQTNEGKEVFNAF